MTATLDDLLALLPDNTTGEIGADDMRTVVSELYAMANTLRDAYAYRWQSSAPPPNNGQVRLDSWSGAATELQIAAISDVGVPFPVDALDAASSAQIRLHTATQEAVLDVTGLTGLPPEGGYAIPVSVASIVGGSPSDTAQVTVSLAYQLP